MFLTLERLCTRASDLSNHVRRYTRTIERDQGLVVTRLEATGLLGHVSVGQPAASFEDEMEVMTAAVGGTADKLRFLAFYFALQYITTEVHCLDILRYHLLRDPERREVAWSLTFNEAQQRFTDLTAAYLGQLCGLLLPPELLGRFVLLGVGTMGDRDDIDVAAVDSLDAAGRSELSHGLSRISQVMLRTSCSLHFHMAEALEAELLSDSVEGYVRALDGLPYSPVVISQLLRASRLVGSEELLTRMVRQVPSRFYYHPGGPNLDHEGFLRAMLGEVAEMLRRPVSPSYISPKADGLRLIKGYLALAKSVYHVPAPTWSEVLRFLRRRSRCLRPQYSALDQALTFLETARYLFQLLVVEKEEIDTAQAGAESLSSVAAHMGFSRRGALDPTVPFLVAYYDTIDALKQALDALLEPIAEHLRRISSLSVFHYPELEAGGTRFNVAVRHAAEARRFLGTRYWDDLLDELVAPGSPVAERWVRDLAVLSPLRRRVVLKTLVEWGVRDVVSFGRLLIPLRQRVAVEGHEELFDEAVDLFLERCSEEPKMAESLASLFVLWPAAVDHFLSLLDVAQLGRLGRIAAGTVDDPELARPAWTLGLLILVHEKTSPRYLERFRAATRHHPEALAMLHDPTELGRLADTLYGQAEGLSDLFSRREWLDAYSDLLVVRLGLELLGGEPYHRVLRRYRRGMHVLLRSLYFMCRRELEELHHVDRSNRHLACILLEAGCRGFHPFDARLDVSMVLFDDDASDEKTRLFFSEVAASFAQELAQLGLGHGRLEPAQPRGMVAAFEAALNDEPADALAQLDRLQILRLGRVVGTYGNLERFNQEVVAPLIEPVRGRISELMASHVASRLAELDHLDRLSRGERSENVPGDLPAGVPGGSAAEPGGVQVEALDLVAMPGGIADLERFFLVIGSEHGADALCEEHPACLPADDLGSAELEQLRESTSTLQTLLALRRLLRGQAGSELVDVAFLHENAGLFRLHPEVSQELLREPLTGLRELARTNLEQMARHLAAAGAGLTG